MIFVEYFSNDLLVEHTVAPSGKKTTCNETMKGKLPARPVDIRAAAKGKTSYTTCLYCVIAAKPRANAMTADHPWAIAHEGIPGIVAVDPDTETADPADDDVMLRPGVE